MCRKQDYKQVLQKVGLLEMADLSALGSVPTLHTPNLDKTDNVNKKKRNFP
jgi:hypothetical protein